jgi:ABC-type glycerol-3-phosphate transport system permease component
MKIVNKILLHALTLTMSIIWLLPVVMTVMNALKTPKDFIMGSFWLPVKEFGFFENVVYAWEVGKLGVGYTSSVIYGLIGASIAILLAALAAYALVVLKVKARLFWFLLIYSGTIFPFQIYLLPLFKLYTGAGLYDTRAGMFLFYAAICIPFCLFVLRNFFTTISKEIVEAAKIDGYSDIAIFMRIYFPLSLSPMAVLLLFQFTWVWNDLLFGMVLTSSNDIRPVMVAMAGMQGIYASASLPAVLTGAVICSIPTIILFFLLRKKFMSGLTIVGNQ